MSALINTKTIKELNNNNFTIASSYITLAFIKEINEIVYQEDNEKFYGKGELIIAFNSFFEKNNITDFKPHPNDKSLSLKYFPYFEYETTDGKIKKLVFKDIETATQTRNTMIQEINDFFLNYKDYVKTIIS